jgi:spermidine synthase
MDFSSMDFSADAAQDTPTISEAAGVRYLHFDSPWVQGAMRIRKPNELVLEYTRHMMAWLLFAGSVGAGAIGLLGLGAGALVRFCLKQTARQVVAVEHNAQVIAVCRTFFRLAESQRLGIEYADAAVWVADPRNAGRCAILMADLYDRDAQGPVYDSVAFYTDCRRVLGQAGILVVNLFGGEYASFTHNVDSIRTAFDDRVVVLPQTEAGNRIALAFCGPAIEIQAEELLASARVVASTFGLPACDWVQALIGAKQGGKLSY